MSKLIDGNIKPNSSCPFLSVCTLRTTTCPTPAFPHKTPFSCSVAREFDVQKPKTLNEKVIEVRQKFKSFLYVMKSNGQSYYVVNNPFKKTCRFFLLHPIKKGIEVSIDKALELLDKESKIYHQITRTVKC